MLKDNYKKIAIITNINKSMNTEPFKYSMNLSFTPSRVILILTYRSSIWYLTCDSKYGINMTTSTGILEFEIRKEYIKFTKDTLTIEKLVQRSNATTLKEIIAIE